MIDFLIISLVILFLPAYLYTGVQAIEFLYSSIGKLSNFDFTKPGWVITKFLFIPLWGPIVYIVFHFALIGFILSRWRSFYKDVKDTVKSKWWEVKFGK